MSATIQAMRAIPELQSALTEFVTALSIFALLTHNMP